MLEPDSDYQVFHCPAGDFSSVSFFVLLPLLLLTALSHRSHELKQVHEHCLTDCTSAKDFEAIHTQHLNKPTIYTSKPTGLSRYQKGKQWEAQSELAHLSTLYPPFTLIADYGPALMHVAEMLDTEAGSTWQQAVSAALNFMETATISDVTEALLSLPARNYNDLS